MLLQYKPMWLYIVTAEGLNAALSLSDKKLSVTKSNCKEELGHSN